MATLSGNKIKDTYQSLVKFSDNGNITTSAKQLTDGFGNNSPMYVSTTQVGIGVTPESGLNLHVYGDAKIGSNLTVIGNLVVEGSTTTVGTDTLTVKDPLIVLANNNTSTDAVDIGFYGKYTPSGTTLYSGLFREALTGKYRLFKGLQVEPTTTVNTSGTGYAVATLVSNLEGNVTGGTISGTTGTFTGNVQISNSGVPTLSIQNTTNNVQGIFYANNSEVVIGSNTNNTLKFLQNGGTALTIDTSKDATFVGGISATTGDFSGNVDIDGTLDVDDVISVEGSGFGRIEVGGASGGYIDLKAPNSDDYDLRLITSTGGAELLSIDTLKFYTGSGTDLAFTIDTSQNATFENNVTIPATPTADTHAASKGYVDSQVTAQDLDFSGDNGGTGSVDLDSQVFAINGTANQITTTQSGQSLTIAMPYNITIGGIVNATTFSGQLDGTISSTTTATTQSQGNNSTKVATTAYVDSAIGGQDTLAEILAIGNTTGGTDIAITAGDKITNFTSTGIDDNASSEVIRITSGGKIGIDEDTPLAKLTVNQDSLVDTEGIMVQSGGDAGNGGVAIFKSANLVGSISALGSSSSLSFMTSGGTTALTLDSSQNATFAGKVLVGTGATAAASLNAYTQTVSTNLYSALRIIENSGASSYWDIGATGGGSPDLNFYVNGGTTPKLTIDSSGNTTFAGNLTTGSTISLTSDGSTGFTNSRVILNATESTSRGAGVFCFNSADDIEWYSGLGYSTDSFIIAYNSTTSHSDGTSNISNAKLAIDSSGNVDITGGGILKGMSHLELLNNGGSDGTATSPRLYSPASGTLAFSGNGSERMRIKSDGDIGINVTNPLFKLDIRDDVTPVVLQMKSSSTSGAGFYIDNDRAGSKKFGFLVGNVAAGAFNIKDEDAGINRFVIDSSGNIGIGTDSPQRLLHLRSTNQATGIFLERTSNYGFVQYNEIVGSVETYHLGFVNNNTFSSDILVANESGNVGIGTSTINGFGSDTVLAVYNATTPRIKLQNSTTGTANTDGAELNMSSSDLIVENREAGNIRIFNNGSERMRIDSSGRVGIGTTSPAGILQVNSSGVTQFILGYNGASTNFLDGDTQYFRSGGGSTRMLLNGTGLGIGNASPQRRLTIGSGGAASETLSIFAGSGHSSAIHFTDTNTSVDYQGYISYGHTGDYLRFGTAENERMRIDSSGKVGIGTTNPQRDLHVENTSDHAIISAVSGTTNLAGLVLGDTADDDRGAIIYNNTSEYLYFQSNGAERMRLESDGDLHVDGDVVAYSTTISDKRLKDNVKPLESSLDKVMNLKGVEYVWNNGSRKGQKDIGFIAQEVENIIPEIVREKKVIFDEEEKYKTVDYEKITAVLVEAVKELKSEIEVLKNKPCVCNNCNCK